MTTEYIQSMASMFVIMYREREREGEVNTHDLSQLHVVLSILV